MRKGRKQLTVLITNEHYLKFEEIKKETGLSNAKIIEMLIDSYQIPTINTTINTNLITEERVKELIQEVLGKPIPTPTPTPPPPPPPPPSEPNLYPTLEDIMNEDPDDQYYILRKTAKVGKPLNGGYKYQYGPLIWVVLDGCRMHYDEKGEIIPYRFTGTDGTVYEPDADELKEIEEAFGKPVKIE